MLIYALSLYLPMVALAELYLRMDGSNLNLWQSTVINQNEAYISLGKRDVCVYYGRVKYEKNCVDMDIKNILSQEMVWMKNSLTDSQLSLMLLKDGLHWYEGVSKWIIFPIANEGNNDDNYECWNTDDITNTIKLLCFHTSASLYTMILWLLSLFTPLNSHELNTHVSYCVWYACNKYAAKWASNVFLSSDFAHNCHWIQFACVTYDSSVHVNVIS